MYASWKKIQVTKNALNESPGEKIQVSPNAFNAIPGLFSRLLNNVYVYCFKMVRPFVGFGHMVQNHTCWGASWTCICFGSPTVRLVHQYV